MVVVAVRVVAAEVVVAAVVVAVVVAVAAAAAVVVRDSPVCAYGYVWIANYVSPIRREGGHGLAGGGGGAREFGVAAPLLAALLRDK